MIQSYAETDRRGNEEAGAALAESRRRAGLTQRALADALGVSLDSVKKIERGKRNPGVTMLGRIDAVLGPEAVREITGIYARQTEAG